MTEPRHNNLDPLRRLIQKLTDQTGPYHDHPRRALNPLTRLRHVQTGPNDPPIHYIHVQHPDGRWTVRVLHPKNR